MQRFSDPTPQLNYVTWVMRLIAWDGALPLAALFLPMALERLLPNRPELGLLEVAVLIAVFFLRVRAGCKHIDTNHCGDSMRLAQVMVLLCAVFLLIFIDTMLIFIPAVGLPNVWTEWLVLTIPFAIYLTAMAFVMYPGREPSGDASTA